MKVRFTESMAGFYSVNSPAYDAGYVVGQRDWNRLSFRLTIGTDDLDRVRSDPDHRMQAVGEVRCKEFSPVGMPVHDGTFDLFAPARSDGRYLMRYRLPFSTSAGEMTLLGYKDVGDDWGIDPWSDTTTLYTRLVRGTADHDADPGTEHARGILRLNALMFARQLTTFRGSPLGVAQFGSFFLNRLLAAYGGPRRKPPL